MTAEERRVSKREYLRQWRAANPEKMRAYRRRWAVANPDKVLASNQRWKAANPEKAREYGQRWRAANLEKARKKSLRWYVANSERARASHRRWAKTLVRLKDKRVSVGFNPRTGVCSSCGEKRLTHLHHKKYDTARPLAYTVELCIPCHRRAHRGKSHKV